MPDLLQHAIALTIVAGCLGYVVRQTLRTLSGRRSRVGNCCATGCAAQTDRQRGGTAAPPSAGQIVYVPIEMLGRGRKA
ncbi:MAG: hypothetical protein JWO31_4130 [Phycisphaerales bacterium]|nr:hypothetical protein [Phycisphaerales bacterium]